MIEKITEIVLVKYRDAGMPTYTYFYTINDKICSPYFDTSENAERWLSLKLVPENQSDNI